MLLGQWESLHVEMVYTFDTLQLGPAQCFT